MELFSTSDYYIIRQGEHSLWCSRKSGCLEPRSAWDLTLANDPVCLGLIHGIIGKLNAFPDTDSAHLLVIESCSLVGYVWNHLPVYKINKIGLLGLGPHEPEITTHPCPKHNNCVRSNQKGDDYGGTKISRQQEALAKTWGSIKSATKSIKSTTVKAAHQIGIDGRDGDRGVRKLLDEVEKMFSQSDSFYFSPDVDLTKSIMVSDENYAATTPSWQTSNSRFFWNKFLLKELIDLEDKKADPWILPVLNGYCHIDSVPVELDGVTDASKSLTLFLISRRSRHRAGTRYKRRGIDDNGFVANYVETEQCVIFGSHVLSFVQIRGSVPVYWSQPGFKYRPPPQIDRGVEDNRLAFRRHFERELSIYGQQCIISLVEQIGKEKIIGDAYTENIIHLNEPRLTFVTFDFHEHCRGMRFENVSRLVNGIEDVLRDMKYTWIDSHGIICQQQSTFRINCMDCLDRTNVCQTSFAKYILEVQLNKLGILPPEGTFWPTLKSVFNVMWANNGDVLSRQYAGTNALKGDFTRTGERRFAGMMKDGMNSANRYYLNRFKDTLKQTVIDLLLGQIQPEDALNVLCGQNIGEDDEEVVLQTADRVRQVIDDCRKQFVTVDEIVVGSWGLVDAHPSTGDPTQVDMDVIVLLTREHLYIVNYDDDADQVTACKKHALSNLSRLEVGPEGKTSSSLSNAGVKFLKSPKREPNISPSFVMRIYLSGSTEDSKVIQFRSTKLRFFNNMAVPICKTEDMNESLKAIAENIHVTMEINGFEIPYLVGNLEKLSSKPLKVGHMEIPALWHGFPRNASEGQLSAFKQAGNKALTSVTSHFSRLKATVPESRNLDASKKTGITGLSLESDSQSSSTEEACCLPQSYSNHSNLSSVTVVKDVFYSPLAGILFLTGTETTANPIPIVAHFSSESQPTEENKPNTKSLLRCVSASQFERSKLPLTIKLDSSENRLKPTPEILVSSIDGAVEDATVNLRRSKRSLSHSSGSVEPSDEGADYNNLQRAASETSLGNQVNAKSSNSYELNAYNIGANVLSNVKQSMGILLTSPTSGKGNPLALFARGVQNIGASFDSRKKSLDSSQEISLVHPITTREDKKENEAENLCLTKIIRL